LLTELAEFLDQCTHSVGASAAADIVEFLCVVDNSYLASRDGDERILVDLSEDMLWWRVVKNLLEHLCDISALSALSLSRLIVSMLNMLAVAGGSQEILLIDRACLDESHYLSVFEQQTEDASADFGDGGCRVASQLLEYRLIDMPLICVRRCKSEESFSSKTVCKIIDKLLSVCHEIDSGQLSDILVHRECAEIMGVTWLHPAVMRSLRRRIFIHCYRELMSACRDTLISDKIALLHSELKPVADYIDQSAAELVERQKNPQHQFERNLFIVRHQLDSYEGVHDVTVACLHAHEGIIAPDGCSSLYCEPMSHWFAVFDSFLCIRFLLRI